MSEWSTSYKNYQTNTPFFFSSFLCWAFASLHSLTNTKKMSLVVSEDALNKLQALMDQGLTFITSSLSFFHLSLFFFSLSPLSLFFFPFIELFLSNDASWGGVTAQNFSGDHFGYSFPYDFNILIFFFCFCFLDVCLFSTSAWSLFFVCVWPR